QNAACGADEAGHIELYHITGTRLAERRAVRGVAGDLAVEENSRRIIPAVDDDWKNARGAGRPSCSERVAREAVTIHDNGYGRRDQNESSRAGKDATRNLEADLRGADIIHGGGNTIYPYFNSVELGWKLIAEAHKIGVIPCTRNT